MTSSNDGEKGHKKLTKETAPGELVAGEVLTRTSRGQKTLIIKIRSRILSGVNLSCESQDDKCSGYYIDNIGWLMSYWYITLIFFFNGSHFKNQCIIFIMATQYFGRIFSPLFQGTK